MAAVANGSGTAAGGAANLDLGPIMMAGKTGTAQAHGYAGGVGAHGAQGAWADRDHAWFIAFAPADDPRYAMSVLVEHGGFGAEAAAPKAARDHARRAAEGPRGARPHRPADAAAGRCPRRRRRQRPTAPRRRRRRRLPGPAT